MLSSAFTMVAIVCLWVAGADAVPVARSRRTAPRTCSTTSSATSRGSATAPVGPVVPVGDPVALLTHPEHRARAGGRRGHRLRRPAGRPRPPARHRRCPARSAARWSTAARRRTAGRSRDLTELRARRQDRGRRWPRAEGLPGRATSGARATRCPQPLADGGGPADPRHRGGQRPPRRARPGLGRLRRRRRQEGLHPHRPAARRRCPIRAVMDSDTQRTAAAGALPGAAPGG